MTAGFKIRNKEREVVFRRKDEKKFKKISILCD